MAQHFLLTADARSLSPLAIARLSDDKCHAMLCELCGDGGISLANTVKADIPPFCLTGFVQVLHNDANIF